MSSSILDAFTEAQKHDPNNESDSEESTESKADQSAVEEATEEKVPSGNYWDDQITDEPAKDVNPVSGAITDSSRFSEFGIEEPNDDKIYNKMKDLNDKVNSGDYMGGISDLSKKVISLLEGGGDINEVLSRVNQKYDYKNDHDSDAQSQNQESLLSRYYHAQGKDADEINKSISKFMKYDELTQENFLDNTVIPYMKESDEKWFKGQKSKYDQHNESAQNQYNDTIKKLDDYIENMPTKEFHGIELTPELLSKAKDQLLKPNHFNSATKTVDEKKAIGNALKVVLFDEVMKKAKMDSRTSGTEDVMSRIDNTNPMNKRIGSETKPSGDANAFKGLLGIG